MRKHILALLAFLIMAISVYAQVPKASKVFVVVEENHKYSEMIGSSSMPYLNQLAQQYGLATNYDANAHYSIPNYMWMTAGATLTLNDGSMTTQTQDNIVRHLLTAGLTWKAYEDSLPSVGFLGKASSDGLYVRRHDPLSFFSDVVNSSTEANNIVPFTKFATDLSNDTLPDFSFITPNLAHDAHNGTTSAADQWLKANIAPLLSSKYFQPGGNGLLIITADESRNTDCLPVATCPSLPEDKGGGHVVTVVIGPQVKAGFKSANLYQHQHLLRTVMEALGMTSFPGAAANVQSMADFFGASSPVPPPPTPTGTNAVTISSPTDGSTVTSPVQVHATATAVSGATVTAMKVYVDGVGGYSVKSNTLDTSVTMTAGTHRFVVQAWNSAGTVYKAVENITVGTPAPTTTNTVTIEQPGANTTQASPVLVKAWATSVPGTTVTRQTIYVDGVNTFTVSNSQSLTDYLTLTAGSHRITVQAWNSAGTIYKSTIYITATTTAPPPPAQHSVGLAWQASTTSGAQYNVYRSATSGGPYTLDSGPVAATSFTDSNVQSGSTYFYVVTAVNSAGESAFSNEATAVIP